MKRSKQFGLLAVAALVAAFLFHHFGSWGQLAALTNQRNLTDYFAMSGPVEIAIFVLAHVVANAVGVPGTLLVIVGGAVFGLWWGTLWSVIGATLGAIAAFALARYFFYDWFCQRFQHKPLLQKINRALTRNALSCVLTIRFSPISPFNVVNFAFGLTPIPLSQYALGTLVGIVPGTLIYTWLGVSGTNALATGEHWPFVLCLFCLMLLSAAPLLLSRSRQMNS